MDSLYVVVVSCDDIHETRTWALSKGIEKSKADSLLETLLYVNNSKFNSRDYRRNGNTISYKNGTYEGIYTYLIVTVDDAKAMNLPNTLYKNVKK